MNGCPLCGAREVGRIGRERYYCRECCHEWTKGGGEVKIYEVLSDGSVEQLETDQGAFFHEFSQRVNCRRVG
jgi:ribosomal protein L37AE/L43A